MISLLLWACPAKKPPVAPDVQSVAPIEQSETTVPSPPTASDTPSPFEGRQQTEQLLTQGILDPIPSQITVDTPVIVQFRTLYRNGCWSQSEPEHLVDGFEITHSYSTSVATDRMCTMALLPGGFQTELSLNEVGEYSGLILVDGEEKAKYRVQVVSAE